MNCIIMESDNIRVCIKVYYLQDYDQNIYIKFVNKLY